MTTPTTPTPEAIRQARRRQLLNEIAQAHGFPTWGKLETAVINGDVTIIITEANMTPLKRTVNMRLFDGSSESFDANSVLSWLQQRYDIDIMADIDGYTVSAARGRFSLPWNDYTSGKCESLSVALCIVALQVNGYNETMIHDLLEKG